MKVPSGIRLSVAFCVLFLCACVAAADDAPIAVTFGGSGFHPVEMDGYGIAAGPHWPVRTRLPETSPDLPDYYRANGSPVAYVRGSLPVVTLEARVPGGWGGSVRVRGVGAGYTFSGNGTAQGDVLRATARAERALPDVIHVVERFRIEWFAEKDGKPLRLGASINALYVLLDPPTGPLVHTPLHIAATRARGLSDKATVIARVWEEFTDREVHRVRDGKILRYYGELNDSAPAELRRMLVAGTGQCVGWTYLLYAALASQGIEGHVTLIAPPNKGRLYIKGWHFVPARRFIDTGANGVAETVPAGDDVAELPRGNGRPYARIWVAPGHKTAPLSGDDSGVYVVGANGFAETHVDQTVAVRLIPLGFGLESQRAYLLEPGADTKAIRLGGDDVVARQITAHYVLTGPNGILETARQPGMKAGRATGSGWDAQVGKGATGIRVQFALPRATEVPKPGGDDRAGGWWIDTGADGVSQTPGANPGRGAPYVVAVSAGANGALESAPGGDDRVVDLAEYLDLAPAGYEYVHPFTLWPIPGVPAQGNENPPPDYPNHMILQVGEFYYDPSYGTGPFRSQLDWERASLAGVGVRIERGGENVRFEGKIIMVARKADGFRTLTSFIRTLPPN